MATPKRKHVKPPRKGTSLRKRKASNRRARVSHASRRRSSSLFAIDRQHRTIDAEGCRIIRGNADLEIKMYRVH